MNASTSTDSDGPTIPVPSESRPSSQSDRRPAPLTHSEVMRAFQDPPRRRGVLTILVLAVSLVGVGLALSRVYLKTIVTWGRPLVVETFEDETWTKRWTVIAGSFAVSDGRLVSTAPGGTFAYFNQRLEGSAAIEYEAAMLPTEPPCDLSVAYAIDDPTDGETPPRRFLLQVGAHDNSYAQILTPAGTVVSRDPTMLEPGRTYRIRMEIDGEVLRILIDGKVICEHRELVPLASGWIGLYAYYPGKVFDNIRIHARGMPALVSPLVIGDLFSRDGDWKRAEASYGRVAAFHFGTDLGDEAAYRQGYAAFRQGRYGEAERLWKPLAGTVWAGRIHLHGLERRLDRHAYGEIATGIAQVYPSAPEDLRQRLVALWTEAIHRAARPGMAGVAELQALIAVRDQYFPDRGAPGAAQATLASGDCEGVLARFPDQVPVAAQALFTLGRDEEVLKRFADRRFEVAAALHRMGRLEDIHAMDPPMPWFIGYATRELAVDIETFDTAETRTRAQRSDVGPIESATLHARLGDLDTAMARLREMKDPAGSPNLVSIFLLAGAREDLRARYPEWPVVRMLSAWDETLEVLAAGGEARLLDLDPGSSWYTNDLLWCAELLIRPFLEEQAGKEGAFAAALDRILVDHRWHFAQQPWFCAAYLRGEIDEAAFLAQPRTGNAPALLAFCQGLGGEAAGDAAKALAGYRAFHDLPVHQRILHGSLRDPLVERFAAWRLARLSR